MNTIDKKKQARKATIKRVKPQKQEPLTFQKVWNMFQETKDMFRETDKQMKETKDMFRETDKKFQETDRKFKEMREESIRESQEVGKRIKELAGLFTTQWGKLVEALLGKTCLAIFKQRGIKITQSSSNLISARDGKHMEIDVLLLNGEEAVMIEVKTTAKVSHVRELLDDLKEFKTFFPQYKSYKIYGGLAALKFEQESDRFAASQGLFTVEPAGEGLVRIKNTSDFVPKGF